jgi:hypothetical protein
MGGVEEVEGSEQGALALLVCARLGANSSGGREGDKLARKGPRLPERERGKGRGSGEKRS